MRRRGLWGRRSQKGIISCAPPTSLHSLQLRIAPEAVRLGPCSPQPESVLPAESRFCALPLYMQLRCISAAEVHQRSEVNTVRTSRWEKWGKRKIAENVSHSVRSFQLRISVQCLTLQIQYFPSTPHHYEPFLNNWNENYLVIFSTDDFFFFIISLDQSCCFLRNIEPDHLSSL